MKLRFMRSSLVSAAIAVFMIIAATALCDAPSATNPAEDIFGKNFKLKVNEETGKLKYNFSEDTRELVSIVAEKDVLLVSDKITLECDHFDYDAQTRRLKARGERVKIKQEAFEAECQDFEYEPDSGRTILTGKPEIINMDEAGRKTTTKGNKVTIERQNEGDTLIQLQGKASLSSDEDSKTTPRPEVAVAPAQRMFGRQFEILTGEKGELLYRFAGANELKTIVARNEVIINSDQMNISCERLEYFSDKNKMLAMGKPVKIFQGSLMAECGRFEYYPEEGKTLLLENPVIMTKDEKGGLSETRGEKITILQAEDGKTSILVEGAAVIEGEDNKPIEEPGQTGDGTAVPVTNENLQIIKDVQIEQD